MKRIYLLLILFIGLTPIHIHAQTLHAIIFAETDDENIGRTCEVDYQKMSIEMSMIATANHMSIKRYFYKDAASSAANMHNVLNNLTCGPRDIVIFYYTGHGARSPQEKTKFPQMCIDHSYLEWYPLYKVYTRIMEKKPQLCIVLGDLCNSIINGLPSKDMQISGECSKMSSQTESAYQSLFSKLTGGIIACSSEPGATSGCNLLEGGFFTSAFLKSLGNMVNGSATPNWNNLFNSVSSITTPRGQAPQFDVTVSTASASSNSYHQTSDDDNLVAALVKMSDSNPNTSERISLINSTKNRYFSSDAKVEIYGKNGTTLLDRMSVDDYLERVATAYKLINFTKLAAETNSSGKITKLKIHEIYKN